MAAGATWAMSKPDSAFARSGPPTRCDRVAATARAYTQSPRFEIAWALHSRMKLRCRRSCVNCPVPETVSRDPVARWMVTVAPTTMHMSPALNTLDRGHELGTAKISPRNASRGFAIATELVKKRGTFTGRPAAASAWLAAGMTPPFATMAMRFAAAPTPMSHRPGTRRLITRKPRART